MQGPGRKELGVALGLAWLLVIARSLVFVVFPHASFDSDEAIVGLMAKHLSEGRAFPLFFYGQHYMLGVESWLAVPWFWIAGPTVAALRVSILTTNLAIVTLLVIGLHKHGSLRPLLAVAATVFFAFAPPSTTSDLMDAQGGNIEQFLWVLVLWFVRARPLVFGAVLAIGFLNREFTIYAVPVLLAGQLFARTLFKAASLRAWLFVAVTFLAVWQSVGALTPLADLMGPGTRGSLLSGQPGSQIDNLSGRIRVDIGSLPSHAASLVSDQVATLVGGKHVNDGGMQQGRNWVGWLMTLAALAGAIRFVMLARRRLLPFEVTAFSWYLLGIGVAAVAGYAATRPEADVVRRYFLLSIFIPIGVMALWLAAEPLRIVRRGLIVLVLAWTILSGADSLRHWVRFASGAEPDSLKDVIAALDAQGVTVAEAPYWRAYKLTFMTGERIKFASTDVVRIEEYQQLARAAGPALLRLQDTPCTRGSVQPVAGFYFCPGPH